MARTGDGAPSENVAVNASSPLPSPGPDAAPAAGSWSTSSRSVLLEQLTQMVRVVSAMGDHEAARVVNEALGKLAVSEQLSGNTADVVRLSAGRARSGR